MKANTHPRGTRKDTVSTAHLHLLVQAALLREVPDFVENAVVGVRTAEDLDRARVGEQHVEDHANGRRLAGAVRAEQTVDRSARNLERELAHGDVLVESLHDLADVDCEIRHGRGVE